MVSAGKGRLQSPGWDPKAHWTPQTRAPLHWETDSMLTDNSWYVTQSQSERGKQMGSQKSSILRIYWAFFGPVLTAMCYKQMWWCYFPRSCCSLLILGFAKPNGEHTDYWLFFSFFPSPFPLYEHEVQPKGAPFPTPQHWPPVFSHFVPLEAEEVNQRLL